MLVEGAAVLVSVSVISVVTDTTDVTTEAGSVCVVTTVLAGKVVYWMLVEVKSEVIVLTITSVEAGRVLKTVVPGAVVVSSSVLGI